jgi:hypothetical protein
MHHLYDRMWLYHNIFQPVMCLKEKRAVPDPDGGTTRVQRIHDQARTPFERVCATAVLEPQVRAQLETLRAATNPHQLREDIYARLDCIFSLPGAVAGQPENVYLTLRDPHFRELGDTKLLVS